MQSSCLFTTYLCKCSHCEYVTAGRQSISFLPVTVPPGIGFLGEPFEAVVDHKGDMVTLPEHGISFTIPEGAVPMGKDAKIRGQCCVGPFMVPEGYQIASPVYLMSTTCKFQKEVKATVSHFVCLQSEEDCSCMTFATAPSTPSYSEYGPRNPNYIFKPIGNGEDEPDPCKFQHHQQEATVVLKHFCFVCILQRNNLGKPMFHILPPV